jgi:hypothetical protein
MLQVFVPENAGRASVIDSSPDTRVSHAAVVSWWSLRYCQSQIACQTMSLSWNEDSCDGPFRARRKELNLEGSSPSSVVSVARNGYARLRATAWQLVA